jgi:site-specific DNA recombinase
MSKDQVKNILTSPFVAGYVKHLTNMFSGQHEAIISKGTWDKTQEMIQRRYTPIPAKDDHNLLTGLIYCEKCGSRMRFKSRIWSSKKTTGNNYYYVCYGRAGYKTMSDHYCSTPYFSAVDINKKVVETLIHYSLNQEELEKFITEKQLKVTNVDINTIKSELANIDKQMDRWLDAFEKGAIDHIILADRTKILNERKIKLEESIADIQKKKDDFEAEIIHANEVLTLLHSLPDIWDKFTIDEKRGLITGIVKKVIVLPDGNVSVKLDI